MAVNLLLLLSALLSALTGAGAEARAVQAPMAVSQVTQHAAAARVAQAVAAGRPIQGLPALAIGSGVVAPAWAIAPAAPLYLNRRRE